MRRFFVLMTLLVAFLFFTLAHTSVTAAAPPQQAPRCTFFTETGQGRGGFNVCDDGQARFLSAFNQWGLQRIGYPISRRYDRDGFVTQAFQKAIMQWRADSNSVVLVNVFDDLHNDGFDARLLTGRQTPNQLPEGWDGTSDWNTIVQKRQALLNARPALKSAYFSVGNPILFFGLPTSDVQDMGNHYAIRSQRAVLQEWKEDVPWARKGQVTIANGGDIAKELGGLPAAALEPEPGSGGEIPPTPPPTSGPTGRILLTSNRTSFDDLYIANADGSGLRQLTTFGKAYDAHFTPDGNAVVFQHDFDIWRVNVDGSGLVNLTNTPEELETFPVVAPDGLIAYTGIGGGINIFVMNADGSNRRAITTDSFDLYPAWSPNGQQIAFTSLVDDGANVWVVNRDGSGLRQVTTFGEDRVAMAPVFSPNGQKLAFTSATEGTAWEVWSIDVSGSNPQRIIGAVGSRAENSTGVVAWKGDTLLIRGYEGNWDPYFLSVTDGSLKRIQLGDKDDKPSDWRP